MRPLGARLLVPPLLLIAVTPLAAFARVGGGEHYDGGEGFSGEGGDGAGDLIGLLIWLAFRHPAVGIPLLIVAVIAISVMKARGPAATTRRAFAQREAELRTKVSASDVSGWVNTLKLRDPSFELLPLLDKVKALFLKTQAAWSRGDLSELRPYLSDATFQRFTVQLGLLATQGVRDVTADVAVLDLQLVGLDQSEWFDSVHIRVRARMRDADVPASATEEQALAAARAAPPEVFTEVWTFVRKPGAQTRIGADLYQGKCPQCGAPYRGGATNVCEFCQAIVNSGNYDWTLSEITQGSEHLRHYAIVDGLLEARRTDPALNIEVLEDRASLLFWRWIDAQSRGDARRLAKLATREQVGQVGGELAALDRQGRRRVFLECAVGAVRVRQLTREGEHDLAHVEVRWSARLGVGLKGQPPPKLPVVPQRWMLTLARRAGSVTDTASGMSTFRCPSCRGPLSDSLSATCDYCGAALGAGAGDWVLLRAATFEAWNTAEDDRYHDREARKVVVDDVVDVDERQRLLYTMAALASADGEVSTTERKLLRHCAERWAVPWSNVETALASGPQMFEHLLPKGTPEAEKFLSGLVKMALVDGRVDRRERRLLEAAASHLGHTDKLVDLLAHIPRTHA